MLLLLLFFKKDFRQCNMFNSKSYIVPSNYKPFYAFVVVPKIVQMMPLFLSQLSVSSIIFCEYLQEQYTVNWCLILWISLISVPSDSQGWLTVISTPYRPRPDSVAVDGKQWLPWLRSLCVSVYPKYGLIHPEGGVCMWVCLNAWVCVFLCASI